MKYAVLSDIHGNLTALKAVLADVARQGAGRVLNLGDILSGPIQPAETADFLMACDFVTIAGNHERQLLQARAAASIDPLASDGYAAIKTGAHHAAWIGATPDMGVNGSRGMRDATADEVAQRLASGTLTTGASRPVSPPPMAAPIGPTH